jgi:hypothetical protein
MSDITKIGLTEQEMGAIFSSLSDVKVDLSKTREAEKRLSEAQHVNPSTYGALEYLYSESYRELKSGLSMIGYKLTQAEKELKLAKAEAILDKYPDFIKDKPKSLDSSQAREAFINRDEEVIKATDKVSMLKAIESTLDSKVRVMEKVCQYMRKQMDLIIRSGSINHNKY